MKSRLKIIFSSVLLASYASYFVADCVCTMMHTADAVITVASSTLAEPARDHHETDHHHTLPSDSQKPKSDDNCCKDIRATCAATIPNLKFDKPGTGYKLLAACLISKDYWTVNETEAVLNHVEIRGSPPKNHDIRIYIQSFLI